jgi:PAS domain S-box-containing protein
VIDNLPDYIFAKDREGRFMMGNKAHAQAANAANPEDLLGKVAADFFPTDLADQFNEDDQNVVQFGQALINLERRTLSQDGQLNWVLTTKVPLRDRDDNIMGLVGISRDITERRQAEEALRRSEAAEREQRLLTESLRDIAAMLTSTLDPTIVMTRILENVGRVVPHDGANIMLIEGNTARIVSWRGYPESIGIPLQNTNFPLDKFPRLREMFITKKPCLAADASGDLRRIGADISITGWANSYAGAPIQAHGQVVGFLNLNSTQAGYFDTIHAERLQAFADHAAIAIENAHLYDQLRHHTVQLGQRVEERTVELFHAKEHVEAILNNSTDAIIVTRLDGTIEHTNAAFSALFGYPGDAALGQSLLTLIEPEEIESLREALADITRGQPSRRIEVVSRRAPDTLFHADIALSGITDQDNQPIEVVCSIRDITERRQMEIGLRETLRKERELGELKSRLISMASHDFRTPLAVILSSATLLQMQQRLKSSKMTDEQKIQHLSNI